MNQTGTSVNDEGIISDYAVSEPSTIVFGGKIPVDINTAYDASGFGLFPSLVYAVDNISIGTANVVGNIYVNPDGKNLTNYQSYARYNNTWEVSYDNPTITAQLNGGDTYVSSFAQSATLYPTFYLEGNGNSGYFIRFAAITQYTPSMPTFTIGSGTSVTIPNQPTYQQLLTISNPSQYGINKAGSNIQFTAPNGTLLYAWIQSINSSSM